MVLVITAPICFVGERTRVFFSRAHRGRANVSAVVYQCAGGVVGGSSLGTEAKETSGMVTWTVDSCLVGQSNRDTSDHVPDKCDVVAANGQYTGAGVAATYVD